MTTMCFYLHIKTADINLHLSSIAIIRDSLTFAAVLRFLKSILSTCSEDFYNEKVGQNYYFRGSLNNVMMSEFTCIIKSFVSHN